MMIGVGGSVVRGFSLYSLLYAISTVPRFLHGSGLLVLLEITFFCL